MDSCLRGDRRRDRRAGICTCGASCFFDHDAVQPGAAPIRRSSSAMDREEKAPGPRRRRGGLAGCRCGFDLEHVGASSEPGSRPLPEALRRTLPRSLSQRPLNGGVTRRRQTRRALPVRRPISPARLQKAAHSAKPPREPCADLEKHKLIATAFRRGADAPISKRSVPPTAAAARACERYPRADVRRRAWRSLSWSYRRSNEEQSIGDVVRGIPRDMVGRIIVADGGSRDATVRARNGCRRRASSQAGTRLRPGLPRRRRMAADGADIVVFMDGDGADDPHGIVRLIVQPIRVRALRLRHRIARTRPARARKHRLAPARGRLAGRLGHAAASTAYATPICARSARSGAMRCSDLGMRESTVRMEHRDADACRRVLGCASWRFRSTIAGAAAANPRLPGSLSGTIRAGTRIIATFARVSSETRSRTGDLRREAANTR